MSHIDAAAGAVLGMLTRAAAAQRVLEVGTADGASGIAIAAALGDDGMLITIERDESRALAARARFAHAGVGARVTVMIGDAHRYLHKVAGPFDLVVQHLGPAPAGALRPRLMQLLRPGGLLVTMAQAIDDEITLRVKR